MSDEERTDQPETEETQPDLLAQVRELLTSEFDNRFSGLQSSFDKRLSGLASTVEQLKTANLSPEEQEQLRDAEAEALRRENALLKLSREYPEEVSFLENFFKAESLEDQVRAMSGFRKPTAPTEPTPEVESEPEPAQPTPVSANNTRREARLTLADMGGEMTEELADQILNAANEPGMLVKIRKLVTG